MGKLVFPVRRPEGDLSLGHVLDVLRWNLVRVIETELGGEVSQASLDVVEELEAAIGAVERAASGLGYTAEEMED